MSPYDKAVRHAQATAKRGGSVKDCAYKDTRWKAAWLKAFQAEQQVELFKKANDYERNQV